MERHQSSHLIILALVVALLALTPVSLASVADQLQGVDYQTCTPETGCPFGPGTWTCESLPGFSQKVCVQSPFFITDKCPDTNNCNPRDGTCVKSDIRDQFGYCCWSYCVANKVATQPNQEIPAPTRVGAYIPCKYETEKKDCPGSSGCRELSAGRICAGTEWPNSHCTGSTTFVIDTEKTGKEYPCSSSDIIPPYACITEKNAAGVSWAMCVPTSPLSAQNEKSDETIKAAAPAAPAAPAPLKEQECIQRPNMEYINNQCVCKQGYSRDLKREGCTTGKELEQQCLQIRKQDRRVTFDITTQTCVCVDPQGKPDPSLYPSGFSNKCEDKIAFGNQVCESRFPGSSYDTAKKQCACVAPKTISPDGKECVAPQSPEHKSCEAHGNADCSNSERCDQDTDVCWEVPCECGEVKNHKCEKYQCCSDSQCGSDEKCDDIATNLCIPIPCPNGFAAYHKCMSGDELCESRFPGSSYDLDKKQCACVAPKTMSPDKKECVAPEFKSCEEHGDADCSDSQKCDDAITNLCLPVPCKNGIVERHQCVETKPAAVIAAVHGDDLHYSHDGVTWQPLTAGTKLAENDRVRTGYQSEADIVFPGGTKVHAKELSEVSVAVLLLGNPRQIQLQLIAGEVQAEVTKQPAIRTEFGVRSPTSVASVRGTIFTVRYDPASQKTTVSVTEGTVDVAPTNPSLAPVTVPAGSEVTVDQTEESPLRPLPQTSKTLYILGGVVLLIVICGVLYWFLKRKKSRR